MVAKVPCAEAVQILREIARNPAAVRALRDFDAGTWGPLPFFVTWQGEEAEVTFAFSGGAITGLASIRVGYRFSNDHDWIGAGCPMDAISGTEVDDVEASLISAGARA